MSFDICFIVAISVIKYSNEFLNFFTKNYYLQHLNKLYGS
jgi:hypothetical protein